MVTLEKASGPVAAVETPVAAAPVTPAPAVEHKATTLPTPSTPVVEHKVTTPPPVVEHKVTPPPQQPPPHPVTHPSDVVKVAAPKPPVDKPADKVATSDGGEPKAGGQGTLLLGSKPPCEIFIDGSSSGLHTPQRDIKLSAGRHKVTLVNNEFGIKEMFTVEIKADQVEKQIKDFSDRIQK